MSADWPGSVDVEIDAYAPSVGTIFASFLLQDSGCHAYGVAADGRRWFLKGSVESRAVASLERVVRVHDLVAHPAIVPLRHVVRTPTGLVLVYPWSDGEVLSPAPPVADPPGARRHRRRASARRAPGSAHARFRALPLPDVLAAFDAVLDAHVAVVAAGVVAVDLYDGCFLYDFAVHRMVLCDLDEYRPGPFVMETERLPGSTRFMAPEEWVRDAVIDERTTVFNLGRAGLVLLDDGPDAPVDVGDSFRGTAAMAAVLTRATRPDPVDRHATVRGLVDDWRRALEVDAR